MSNEKLVIFEDDYSDTLEVDMGCPSHLYISTECSMLGQIGPPVELTPKDVKKLRKQLKKWLIENDYKDSKGE